MKPRQILSIFYVITLILSNVVSVSAAHAAGLSAQPEGTEKYSQINAPTDNLICESFDSGWTDGAKIDNTDWYSNNGPTIEQGEGVASSWGVSPSGNIFIWKTQTFSWSDSSLTGVVFQLDFETDSSAEFDDDRVGWQTTNTNVNSNFIFGVQLDNASDHQRIEGYWDHVYNSGDDDGRPEIVDLDSAGLTANSWYRLIAEFTKLTNNSAKIDVELWLLDSNGDPASLTASGSLADTSALGATSPNASPAEEYFTTTNLYPAYKNHTGAAANADNACYEIVTGAPPVQYTLTVSDDGNGSVTLNPAGGVYNEGTVVQLTANPAIGYAFTGWGGDLGGSVNPESITMDEDKDVTAAFEAVPPVDLTITTVGNGGVTLDPTGGTYDVGTVVELTANPDSGWYFSGWSEDLSGNTNPTNITMDEAKSVTATFLETPPSPTGTCEDFESGFTIDQVVGTHAEWFDSGSGPVVTSGNGLAGSIGLAPGSSIFTWVEHPFDWNDPAFESISFSMDFQTNASGYFDDDRLGWMITDADASSTGFFGVQLDTVSDGDGGIVTYWRDESDTRIQTPIVTLSALATNTWFRFEATISKLTDTSAKIDVSLVELDASGNLTGTPYTGTLDDTSTWADGTPNLEYFTAESMWPAYKNYSNIIGAADNACFDVASGRFSFIVSTDWHTSDSDPNTDITTKVAQIANWVNSPTEDMPAPEFMVVTGDFPDLSQTASIIDTQLGSDFLWYPVMGNHEVSDDINNFYDIRDTLVPTLPNIVDYGPTGSVNSTYSWDYENAHFVSLNGYWNGNTSAGSDTAADGDVVPALNSWLVTDLTTNGKTHNIAFIHEPAYPANRHVGDSLDAYPTNRDAFVATLNSYNVETLFTGHTHYFEHDVAPEYPLGNLDQVTNGSLRSGDETTVTYVLVEGNTTTYKVYSWSGSAFTLLDQWSIGSGLPSTPPSAPTDLSASAVSYNQIHLAWTDNADNETGFEIERSTSGSGGPFSLRTTVLADIEIYNDFGLDPESEYCYRVRAVNGVGSSDYTNVACDTTPEQPAFEGVCESFDAFSPLGNNIGSYTGWYDGGSGPVVTAGSGLVGTVGLDPASAIFIWTANPFDWKDSSLPNVSFQMDFQTNESGQFDDDRIGWTIADNSVDSTNIFGVQLDHSDGGIVTYWRDSSDERVQTVISALPTLPTNTWYRFYANITKLTAISARIDVSLTQLDTSGNPTGASYTGSVPDTSIWSGGAPDSKYFTADIMWPAYKNYSAITGAADNTCYEVQTGTPPTGTLVGYWRFDDGVGSTAEDSSEYNNNGNIVDATWTTGKVAGALNFDGDSDYVQVPASSSLSLNTNQMTLLGWVYQADVAGSWKTIIQRANVSNNWFDWQLYSRAVDAPTSNHPVFRADWNNDGIVDPDESVEGDIVLEAGAWYFIAVTYDGAALKFYIDGTLRDTTAKAGGVIPNSNRDIWIGGNETWGEYFTGKIDEFRIYNQALSIGQIQALMEIMAPEVSIAEASGDVELSWLESGSGVDHYEVWRASNAPYFTPGDAGSTKLGDVAIELDGEYAYLDTSSGIGDVNDNSFYVVRAADSGSGTADSNRVGEMDYAVIRDKYNAIGFPLEDERLETADDLGVMVGAAEVLQWKADTQSFDPWNVEYGVGNDFTLGVGAGYLVYTPGTGAEIFTTLGNVPEAGSVSFAIERGASPACKLNLVTLPLDQEGISNAEGLGQAIGGVTEIAEWKAGTGSFDPYNLLYMVGNNFATLIGYPYWPCADDSGGGLVWPTP